MTGVYNTGHYFYTIIPIIVTFTLYTHLANLILLYVINNTQKTVDNVLET